VNANLISTYKTLSAGVNDLTWKAGAGSEFLLGVNLEETTAAGDPVPDSGAVWIQDSNSDNSMSLLHGGLVYGQLAGFGCVPLSFGDELKARVYHAADGNIAKLNVRTLSQNEYAGLAIPINWTPRQVPSLINHRGKPCRKTYLGVAASTTLDIIPTDGQMLEIVTGWISHNDPANPALSLGVVDGGVNVDFVNYGAVTSGTFVYIGALSALSMNIFSSPLVISSDFYLRVTAASMASGKSITARLICREYAE
jgi:hypothetical protein